MFIVSIKDALGRFRIHSWRGRRWSEVENAIYRMYGNSVLIYDVVAKEVEA